MVRISHHCAQCSQHRRLALDFWKRARSHHVTAFAVLVPTDLLPPSHNRQRRLDEQKTPDEPGNAVHCFGTCVEALVSATYHIKLGQPVGRSVIQDKAAGDLDPDALVRCYSFSAADD